MMGKINAAAAGSSTEEQDVEGADVTETPQPDGQAGEADIDVAITLAAQPRPPVSPVRMMQKVGNTTTLVHTAAVPSQGPRDPSMIGEPPSAHYDSNEHGKE
jgi:hypothetical protein